MNDSFYQLFLKGKVSLEQIDDFISEWHNGDSELELSEFLGLSWEQYAKFVETGIIL